MHPRSSTWVALIALGLLALAAGPVRSGNSQTEGPPALATPQQARQAAEQGLAFLVKDAATWRAEKKCATCHHGTMTAWALAEAKSQGYAVAAETLADVAKWTRERLANID